MSSNDNVQRKPQFSRKEDDYPVYKMQLETYLIEADCSKAILESFDSKLPATCDGAETTALDKSDTGEKAQNDAQEMNSKVMRVLILGMGTYKDKDKSMLNLIALSKEPGWNGGKA